MTDTEKIEFLKALPIGEWVEIRSSGGLTTKRKKCGDDVRKPSRGMWFGKRASREYVPYSRVYHVGIKVLDRLRGEEPVRWQTGALHKTIRENF